MKTLSRRSLGSIAGLVLIALGSAACTVSDVLVDRKLDTCQTSHQIRQMLNDMEDVLTALRDKAKAGTLTDDYVKQARLALSRHAHDRSEDFHSDVTTGFCALHYDGIGYSSYNACRSARAKVEAQYTTDGFIPYGIEYARTEVERLTADSFNSVEEQCRPGLVYETQPDGSTKLVDNPCAYKEKVYSHTAGYDEAVALGKDLQTLQDAAYDGYFGYYYTAPFEGWNSLSKLEEILATIQRIKSNGVATYLALKCSADSAFVRLDGKHPKNKSVDDWNGVKSAPSGQTDYEPSSKNLGQKIAI